MAYTAEEYKQMKIKQTLDYHGITKWHEMGRKGKGINYLELENSEHGRNVIEVFSIVAPEAKTFLHGYTTRCKGDECLYFNINVNGEYIDLAEFVKDNNIHIIGLSTSSGDGGMARPAEEYLKALGVILVASAGNNNTEGVTATLENVGINVGAIKIMYDGTMKQEHYSAVGEDTLHFVTLHMHLSGTSFSQPTNSGIIALIMAHYGIMTQSKIIEVLKSICKKNPGLPEYDTIYGFGAPVLPENIAILEGSMIIKYSGRLCHLESFSVLVGQLVKKGEKIGVAGDTGDSYGRHVDLVFVQDEEYYPSHGNVEAGKQTVDLDALNTWGNDNLFKTEHRRTTTYLEEGYKENYSKGLYEHHGVDEVPLNGNDWGVHACEDCIILATGYNEAAGNYIVIGVEEMKFKDVETGRWSEPAIDYVTDAGYMQGIGDNKFDPSAPLTREQMAQVLYNLDKINGKI